MTDTSANADCHETCSPKGYSDPACGCSPPRASQKVKIATYSASFIALCGLCCAVPPVLIGLGLIGMTTGAYLSAGSTVALIVLAVLGLGYLVMRYVKKTP